MTINVTDTVRLVCLKQIKSRLAGITAGVNNAALSFDAVELGPITDQIANRKRSMIGIVPGREVKNIEFPLTICILPVSIEFKVTWGVGDPPAAELIEHVLGDIQKAILSDTGLSGNALDVRDIGNEIQMNAYTDKSPSGVAFFDLVYRHNTLDPTQPV